MPLKESHAARFVDVLSFSSSPDSISRNQRLKEEETFGGTETLTRVCGETEGLRDGVQSRWNKPTALCVYRNTIFVCDTGNKAVRNVDVSKWTDPPAK